ncbi:hypothetical protein F5876DRAFT_63504 [Lentinula aff. lateritia]|uniref:Uncharacterized protein n=1 Tax=Lentinula aff. lateritia TaxID=2804960 RepID=A0ACC1U8A0_9AGAR|nr:hypothetical protein F5876DRAFT_63504 [Lentinula aff. lateritia]
MTRGKPLSEDLCHTIINLRCNSCKRRTLQRILSQHRKCIQGTLLLTTDLRGRKRKISIEDMKLIHGLLAHTPDMYLDELKQQLEEQRGTQANWIQAQEDYSCCNCLCLRLAQRHKQHPFLIVFSHVISEIPLSNHFIMRNVHDTREDFFINCESGGLTGRLRMARSPNGSRFIPRHATLMTSFGVGRGGRRGASGFRVIFRPYVTFLNFYCLGHTIQDTTMGRSEDILQLVNALKITVIGGGLSKISLFSFDTI